MAQMARAKPKAVPKHNITTAQGIQGIQGLALLVPKAAQGNPRLPKARPVPKALARTGLVPKAQNHTKALHAPVSKAQPPGAAPVVPPYP